MKNAISKLGADKVYAQIMALSKDMKVPEELHIDYVCRVCCNVPEIAPDMNNRKKEFLSIEKCMEAWVKKFFRGYNERISQHKSKIPGTVPDKAINAIIEARLPELPSSKVDEIVYAHRLGMSAENILGLLLEEFLFEKLSPAGWAMAWGESVKHVDFCHKDGKLLQIKNRSNSENSSSNKIRNGKPIEKWFRVNANNGHYQWESLKKIVGQSITGLNEEEFQKFIFQTLKNNPYALAIEHQSPWMSFKDKGHLF